MDIITNLFTTVKGNPLEMFVPSFWTWLNKENDKRIELLISELDLILLVALTSVILDIE